MMSSVQASKVGGQQKGEIHRCGLFFQIKKARSNIQQKGLTVLPVVRCRCATEDGKGCLSKVHLFSFLSGLLHCLL